MDSLPAEKANLVERREFGFLGGIIGRKHQQVCTCGFGSRGLWGSSANVSKTLAKATQVLVYRVEPIGRRIHCSRSTPPHSPSLPRASSLSSSSVVALVRVPSENEELDPRLINRLQAESPSGDEELSRQQGRSRIQEWQPSELKAAVGSGDRRLQAELGAFCQLSVGNGAYSRLHECRAHDSSGSSRWAG